MRRYFPGLVEPEVGGELGGGGGVIAAGCLPIDIGGEVCLGGDAFGERLGGGGGGFTVGGFEREDEFAGIGEVGLVELETLDDGEAWGEEVQDFDVEAQPYQSEEEQNGWEQPPPSSPAGCHLELGKLRKRGEEFKALAG